MTTKTKSLKQIIKNKNIKRYALAHKIGINRATLWEWLSFEDDLTINKKELILKAIQELSHE
ncbi:hypothetical protein ACKP2L_03520 [Oenococcus alcoholitolerans]|uniref:hypothetical protein n=1 Tax=Oenococcus alcoholitolerans TaxID=931074 RepID=UPI003F7270BA